MDFGEANLKITGNMQCGKYRRELSKLKSNRVYNLKKRRRATLSGGPSNYSFFYLDAVLLELPAHKGRASKPYR